MFCKILSVYTKAGEEADVKHGKTKSDGKP
jgi:hypothetical protein